MSGWKASDLKGRKGIKAVNYQGSTKSPELGVTRIIIHDRVPGMNSGDGLIREHWGAAIKRVKKMMVVVALQTKNQHQGQVVITFRKYTTRLMDWDNYCSSFKHIGDALHKCNVIEDDNPGIVSRFIPEQIKVRKKDDEFIEVLIENFKP